MAKKKTKKNNGQKSKQQEDNSPIEGLILFSIALILMISLGSFSWGGDSGNLLGLLGDTLGWTFHAVFGLTSFMVCTFIGWIGWRKMFSKPINHLGWKILYASLSIISLAILLSLLEDQFTNTSSWLSRAFYPTPWIKKIRFHLGGAPFYYFYRDLPSLNLFHIFNYTGIAIIFSALLLLSLMFLFKISPVVIFRSMRRSGAFLKAPPPAEQTAEKSGPKVPVPTPKFGESDFLRFVKLRIPGFSPSSSGGGADQPSQQELLAINPETNLKVRPSLSRKGQAESSEDPFQGGAPSLEKPLPKVLPKVPEKLVPAQVATKREQALTAQKVHNGDFSAFALPPGNLLTVPKKVDQSLLKKDLKKQAEVLEETLLSFGIEAKVGQINCGPTITSFEVHPAIGVKVQKIKTLENDIALNMEAKSIRIIAPIPGKAAVGIEVPNAQPQEVGFKDMLSAYQQSGRKFHIPILLGKAVNGDYVMSDLTKMPHCIIAGATGSGKSVCINTIVMSMLMNAKPDEIKLIMVDPKKVELTPYTKLPHMLAPVITEPHGACEALRWLVKEMENRYDVLKLTGVRNIEGFNNRTQNKEHELTLGREIPEKMPYIVGIIDELADLMMAASSDIETPIARIAQMARAVGIHLILATQRPSREVITGLIKANFPTRISFKVASRVNSQIVLDEIGAESLLGNGDMLFLPPGASHLVRAQGAFIRDEDINAVIKQICDQAPPNYVIESFDYYSAHEGGGVGNAGEAPSDAFFEQARDIVLSTGNASTTFLQRKLKIGYARAASLMDQLEIHGIVGPAEGSKPRKILAAKPAGGDEEFPFDDEDLP